MTVRHLRAAVLGTAFAALSLTAASRPAFHATLKKSSPAANDTLASAPDTLKLWFSERVELGLTKVSVTSGGKPVMLGALAMGGPAADAPVVAALPRKLAPATYAVDWTVAAKDGHPSKGTFTFTIKAK